MPRFLTVRFLAAASLALCLASTGMVRPAFAATGSAEPGRHRDALRLPGNRSISAAPRYAQARISNWQRVSLDGPMPFAMVPPPEASPVRLEARSSAPGSHSVGPQRGRSPPTSSL